MESLPPNRPETVIESVPAPETPLTHPASPHRRPWLPISVGAALLLAGLGVWRFWPAPRADAAASSQQSGPTPRPVEMTTLSMGTGTRPVQLLGQVVASQSVTVRAQADGVVQQIFVNVGDRVNAGQVLAKLDPAAQTLALSEARARLAQQRSQLARLQVGTRPEILAQRRATLKSAKAREQEAADNLRRLETLKKEGAIAERLVVEARSALEDARGARLAAEATLAEALAGPIQEEIAAQQANVAAAQAALNQASLTLERTQIRAVSAGTVQTRLVSVGDLIESGNPLLTLVAGNQREVFLELPEDLTGQVGPGTPIQLRARSLPQWRGKATLTSVVPVAEAGSRRQRVRVVLQNPPSQLLPGTSILGQLALPVQVAGGFVVSRDTLSHRQTQWQVVTVVDGKAKPIPVTLLADMGETVAITSPQLQAGQQIIVRGGDGLNAGMPVKIVTNPANPTPAN
jgi:HlyD family secretion protein